MKVKAAEEHNSHSKRASLQVMKKIRFITLPEVTETSSESKKDWVEPGDGQPSRTQHPPHWAGADS